MIFEKMIEVYNKLQDRESRELFSIMIRKMMSTSQLEYISELVKYCNNPLLENRLVNKIKNHDGIIIYGCGEDGRLSKLALEKCGYRVAAFCDTYQNNIEVDNTIVVSVDDMLKEYPNHLICICSRKYGMEMYRNLLVKQVSENDIYVPTYGIIIGSNSRNQYIDVMDAPKEGVIIDGGAYDGATAKQFIDWVGKGNYSRIVCYEPEEKQAQYIQNRVLVENLQGIDVINAGLWNEKTELRFSSAGAGSTISVKGDTVVSCVTIDDTVKDKVSFIKMDIEGAELKALQGAVKTIKRDKPKMAICIYHKISDIYDIGSFIIDIWPDCKLKIRHYTTYSWETVLYIE